MLELWAPGRTRAASATITAGCKRDTWRGGVGSHGRARDRAGDAGDNVVITTDGVRWY